MFIAQQIPAHLAMNGKQALEVLLLLFVRIPHGIIAIIVVAEYRKYTEWGRQSLPPLTNWFGFGGAVVHQIACKHNQIRLFGHD